jgi:hypothetical protein
MVAYPHVVVRVRGLGCFFEVAVYPGFVQFMDMRKLLNKGR